MTRFLVFILVLFMAQAAIADSGDKTTPLYVGWKRCALCHKGKSGGYIVESWKKSKHANAYNALGAPDNENPQCLKCHTTAVKKKYGPGVVGSDMEGVQCEACHGPGSEYRKSRDRMEDREAAISYGLILPDEQTCIKCHNEECPHYRPFNFSIMYPMIEHHLPNE